MFFKFFIYFLFFTNYNTFSFKISKFIPINNFNKINGFYGLIGGVNSHETKITEDGILQGVFIENGKIVKYVKHIVNTDRQQLMNKHPETRNMINSRLMSIIVYLLKKIDYLPGTFNIEGKANTGLISVKENHICVLHERDFPYEIKIDFDKKCVDTTKKIIFESHNNMFSAHSTYNKKNNLIESVTYQIIGPDNGIYISQYDNKFNLLNQNHVKTKYNSIVHDFISTKNHIYVPDCPLELDMVKVLFKESSIPLTFDKNKMSRIGIWDKRSETMQWIGFKESFFIFHFINAVEIDDNIIVLDACVFDNIDFEQLNKNFPYVRRLIIDKKKREGYSYIINHLKNIPMDFPTKINDDCFLLLSLNHINNVLKIPGFYILDKNHNIMRKFMLPTQYDTIYGQISYDEKSGNLVGLCSKYSIPCLFFYNINNDEISFQFITSDITEDLHRPVSLERGFHSIFIPKS